ncbi:MAG: dihydrolipoamide acetyltransferase family protein [Chloroflexota bacterium]|nr:dihydrolipoamide acetyltransferase family protein [Chloroflexota bacterium]
MATAVYMPRWGMIMEEGRIVEWLKKEGDEVVIDDPILIVQSEKVDDEVAAPATGVLRVIVVPAGENAAVGAVLAIIASTDEPATAIEALMEQSAPHPAVDPPPSPTSAPPSSMPKPRRVKISPAARRMAEDKGIDWQNLEGTGPRGRIERKDVLRAIETAQTASTMGKRIPLSPMRQAIARRTLESIQSPQAALCREIDITSVLRFRQGLTESNWPQNKPPTFTAILAKASALALAEAPILNARLKDESIWLDDNVHIGIVVAIEDGIVVPVILEANQKSLFEIATELNELTQRARAGRLTLAEMEGGTFTISNAGPLGIDFFQALLYPPQVGALGVGRGRQRAVVVDGEFAVRTMCYFCISSDHRVVDAEPIGRFLNRMDEIMQNPDLLLESAVS